MPYAIRVRLYCGPTLEADTDPELPLGEPGSEVVADIEAMQRAMVELCEAFHGPDVKLLGFSPLAMGAYSAGIRSRARSDHTLTYRQGYIVLLDTPQLRSATSWMAQVDMIVSG